MLLDIERCGSIHDMFKSSKKSTDNARVSSRIVTNLCEHLKILLKRWLTDLQDTGPIGKIEDAWLGLATNQTFKNSLP